jgi:hypothetical protein
MIQPATAAAGADARAASSTGRTSSGDAFLALFGALAGPATRPADAEPWPARVAGPTEGLTEGDPSDGDPGETMGAALGFGSWPLAGLTGAATPGADAATGTATEAAAETVPAGAAVEHAAEPTADAVPAAAVDEHAAGARADAEGEDATGGARGTADLPASLPGPRGSAPSSGGAAAVGVTDERSSEIVGLPAAGAAAETGRGAYGADRSLEGQQLEPGGRGSEQQAVSGARPATSERTEAASAELHRSTVRAAEAAHDTPASAVLDSAPADRAAGYRADGPTAATSTTLTRLLDAIERLEQAPPPRQLTVELGELRVRLALEDGTLRIQLLGEARDADRELLREATDALAARGFDLDQRHDGRERATEEPKLATDGPNDFRPRAAARTAARLPAVGLHL